MNKKELITEFRKRRLELNSDLEKRLEKANLLKGRKKYRSFESMTMDIKFILDIDYALNIPEDEKSLKSFDKTLDLLLNRYFEGIVALINSCGAWQLLDINKDDYVKEKFDNLKVEEKFRILYYLNTKYISFLSFQQTADEREALVPNSKCEIDEESLKKMAFLEFIFYSIGNKNDRDETIYCMNKVFLSELMKYRKSKTDKIEEYMKGKKRNIQFEFEKFGRFLSEQDFLDIADAIIISTDALKCPKEEVINFFYQMSETISEKRVLADIFENFRKLEAKTQRMQSIRNVAETARKAEEIEKEKALAEEKERKRLEELEERKKEELRRNEEKAKKFPEVKLDKQIQELEQRIALLQGIPTVKEYVIPVIFLWADTKDISLRKKIGNKRISKLFSKLKQIEQEQGIRTSLYIMTTANKEITSKRFQELRELSIKNNMPRLVEGAIGAYGSFRIDEKGNIKDRAVMSEENREMIMHLVEKTTGIAIPRDMVDSSVVDFLRYRFSDGNDKKTTKDYLSLIGKRLLESDSIKSQPLKLFLYEGEDCKGIDILLKSQAEGMKKVADYFKAKYHIVLGEGITIDIDELDKFLALEREEEK